MDIERPSMYFLCYVLKLIIISTLLMEAEVCLIEGVSKRMRKRFPRVEISKVSIKEP